MLLVKVFTALNKMKVRYLVAGGVAAVLYGNPRFTKDLDLLVDPDEKNLTRMVNAFKKLKFIPRLPVAAEEFVSRANRERWLKEKGMLAFTFINPKNPFENVDILTSAPVAFGKVYARKKVFKSGKVRIPTIAVRDLMMMKRRAGRPQDLNDVAILEESIRRGRRSKNAH